MKVPASKLQGGVLPLTLTLHSWTEHCVNRACSPTHSFDAAHAKL